MTTNLTEAVQGGVKAKLSAGVTLATTYIIVPEKTQPPVVVIAESDGEQVGGKGANVESHAVRIITIVAGESRKPLFALQQQVKDALHEQLITYAGAVLSRPVMQTTSDRADQEAGVIIGEQVFQVFAQPA